jgi:hypothetical protein
MASPQADAKLRCGCIETFHDRAQAPTAPTNPNPLWTLPADSTNHPHPSPWASTNQGKTKIDP